MNVLLKFGFVVGGLIIIYRSIRYWNLHMREVPQAELDKNRKELRARNPSADVFNASAPRERPEPKPEPIEVVVEEPKIEVVDVPEPEPEVKYVEPIPPKPRKIRYDPVQERIRKLISLRREGKSIQEIAQIMGVSTRTIDRWLLKLRTA